MKMRIACGLIVLTLIFAGHFYAADVEAATSGDVNQTVVSIMEEAGGFFGILLNKNQLPSTQTGTVARSRTIFDHPGGALKYPLTVTIHVELNNTAETQEYTLQKAGTGAWNVLSGLQLDSANEKIAELTLPSEADQTKANAALSLETPASTDSASSQSIKLLEGECLLLKSELGQAVVMFTRFSNKGGGKSTYKWRYQAAGEKQVTSGEGSVFENEARLEHASAKSLQKKAGKQVIVQAGTLEIEWSYGLEHSFGWFYYDSQKVTATKIAIPDFDTYSF